MLISDIFKENSFVNSAIIGLSNVQVVIFMSEKQYNRTRCNSKGLIQTQRTVTPTGRSYGLKGEGHYLSII